MAALRVGGFEEIDRLDADTLTLGRQRFETSDGDLVPTIERQRIAVALKRTGCVFEINASEVRKLQIDREPVVVPHLRLQTAFERGIQSVPLLELLR